MDGMASAKVNATALNATFSGSKYCSFDSLPPEEHFPQQDFEKVSKSFCKVSKQRFKAFPDITDEPKFSVHSLPTFRVCTKTQAKARPAIRHNEEKS